MTARATPVSKQEPVLRAVLPSTSGGDPWTVSCAAGEIVEIPDDDGLVARLVGERRMRADRLQLAGRRIDRRGPAGRVRAGFASVRGTEVAPDVSVADHLVAAAGRLRGTELLDRAPLLSDRKGDPAGVLSGGERRALGWLLADAVAPRAVLLDRAGTGFDTRTLSWAHGVLDGWLDAGAGILLRIGRAEEQHWAQCWADGRRRAGSGRV